MKKMMVIFFCKVILKLKNFNFLNSVDPEHDPDHDYVIDNEEGYQSDSPKKSRKVIRKREGRLSVLIQIRSKKFINDLTSSSSTGSS